MSKSRQTTDERSDGPSKAVRHGGESPALLESFRIETKIIHAGEPRPRCDGAVVMPIYQSSTYEYTGATNYHDVRYLRLNNNPNQLALNRKIAALEGAEAAVVTSSGMSAISTALLTVLSSGDHLLTQNCLYGGTHGFVSKDLRALGITQTFVDGGDSASWENALRPNTKAFYIETLSNPLLEVPDVEAVVEFARANNLVTLIDNTFASPIQCRPAELGIDITLESCTKYMNGHNDLVAGAAAGSADMVRRIKEKLDHLGGSLDPHACFLLQRGLKTLAIRVRYQSDSALRIASFLEQHPRISMVSYPGLTSHPHHLRAKKLLGGCGGVVSFEIEGGAEAAERCFGRLKIPAVAPSLGGVESLIVRPAAAVHTNLTPEERARTGVTDGLVRLSVGLEATQDLIDDLDSSLAAV